MNNKIFLLLFSIVTTCVGRVRREEARMAIAYISGPDVNGIVSLIQDSRQSLLQVIVEISGLRPGLHGFHVHATGDLSGGCDTLGGHFNPENQPHGSMEDSERHTGDWGNIEADLHGDAYTMFTDSKATLYGPNKIRNRGIVVHERADDLGKTDHPDSKTTGNAGARVACGVITMV